jgi:endonuclease/exonuclease/phosphatase family metal-dependent hydrolase
MGKSPSQAALSLAAAVLVSWPASSAEAFRVATYNLNNYLLAQSGSRPAKPVESKAAIREALRVIKADVLALQEIGGTNALQELRALLQADGLTYPHWEHITAHDTNIQVAVLSRFPITARKPHTNDSFLLYGRRFRVGRGFAEVEIQVNPNYSFTLITAHLKSKVPVPEGDQAELREQEAKLLRAKVDAVLKANPDANLIVLGDFNDTKDTSPIRTLLGKALVDTRPAERNNDVSWTYHYAKEDTYSRVDYVLLSKGMAREWRRADTYILAWPDWRTASDHRPLIATFSAANQ